MKSKALLFAVMGGIGAMVVLGQAPAPGPAAAQQGPGVQAPADARYADWVAKNCKVPPPPRGGGRGGPAGGAGAAGPGRGDAAAGRGGAAADPNAPPQHREYTVKEIPG